MWSSFKSWFGKPEEDKNKKTRKLAKYVAHYVKHGHSPRKSPHSYKHHRTETELANALKISPFSRKSSRKHQSLSDSDTETRHSSRHSRHSSRHSRHSRDDKRIHDLKAELAKLDRKYTSVSESEGNTADLQRQVAKLEGRFMSARQQLVSALATKAARQAAHLGPHQISAAVSAALSAAGLAAPGLSSIAPATPATLAATASYSAAMQSIQQNPNPSPVTAAYLEAQVRDAEAKKAAAMEEAGRIFDIDQAHKVAASKGWSAAGTHLNNFGQGVTGLVTGVPVELATAASNTVIGWRNRLGRAIGF